MSIIAKTPIITKSQGVKIIFELTNLCNFNCFHCIREQENSKQYLPLAIIEKVLKEVKPYHNVNFITFTGGEPTLHPHFEDIIRMVTEYGYQFGFVTNGWNFQDTFVKIKPFKDYIPHITLSIDGATEKTHDALRSHSGSFRRLMQAITLCKYHGIKFHINMVITRSNRSEIEAMAMLASRLGCDILFYGHCKPTPDSLTADLILNTQERRQIEADISALQKIFQMRILLAGDHYDESLFYQCSQFQMKEFNVDYRGNFTFCCLLSSYRGGMPDTDVLVSLNDISFYEAHRRLIAKIAEINVEKIERLSANNPDDLDYFTCSHCLKHFRKVR
jgi:MoaA/NifB/PqqE/SkfB family radical SAM enzyme